MIGRNGRSAIIYRRSGASRVRVQVRGGRCLQGRRVCPLLKHGKGVESTSQDQGGGGEARQSPASHVQILPMLSAFQARKVRLAASPGVQEPTAPSPAPASPDPQSPAPGSTPRRSSRKRKPEPVAGNEADQPHRRKKTDDRKVEGKVRYFDAPVDVPEPDLHSLTDEDISLSDQEILSHPHEGPRRAWSPSQPLLDSSDEETGTEPGCVQPTDAPVAAVAAPFAAELGVNTFPLTPEECFALISVEEPAAAIILPVHSTISFTGVYQLTVLQGAVILMGVTLAASNTSHTVFSPKLSPLPCIESLGNTDLTSPLTSRLHDRLRPWISPEHAVILIHARHTRIEGLGRVIRTFESMFQPSQPSNFTADLEVPGVQVHVVCFHSVSPNNNNLLTRSGRNKNETSRDSFSQRRGIGRLPTSLTRIPAQTEAMPPSFDRSRA